MEGGRWCTLTQEQPDILDQVVCPCHKQGERAQGSRLRLRQQAVNVKMRRLQKKPKETKKKNNIMNIYINVNMRCMCCINLRMETFAYLLFGCDRGDLVQLHDFGDTRRERSRNLVGTAAAEDVAE